MENSKSINNLTRYALGGLLLLVALNAFGGGYYGLAGAKDVPVEWLKGSPFKSYFIPSLILFVCVGGSALFAAIAVLRKSRMACRATFFCLTIIFLWLTIQVIIIGYVSWMQPATAITALLILWLTLQLPANGD